MPRDKRRGWWSDENEGSWERRAETRQGDRSPPLPLENIRSASSEAESGFTRAVQQRKLFSLVGFVVPGVTRP